MGGVCSRKREQQVNEESINRGLSVRYFKSGSSKWLGSSILRAPSDIKLRNGKCPSLMELCIYDICEVCRFFYEGYFWKSRSYGLVD